MSADLKHKRILLTRTSRDNQAWIEALAALDIVGVNMPCIQTQVIRENAVELANHLRVCDGLLFSSPRAVRAVLELCPEFDLASVLCACVGEGTARIVEQAQGRVEFIAPQGTAQSLGQTWIERMPAKLCPLWPRAFDARAELVPLFEAHQRRLETLPIYHTRPRRQLDQGLAAEVDAIFFASPSAANAFLASGSPAAHVPVISIGPSTTQALESQGVVVAAEAQHRSLDGMLEALLSSITPLCNPDRPPSR